LGKRQSKIGNRKSQIGKGVTDISRSLSGAAAVLAATIEETIASKGKPKLAEGELGYVKPSSLAKGCMLYIALELKGTPKAEIDPRVQRILEVGTASHNRIPRYFARLTAAREMFFQDEEYRLHGYADALVYVPPERGADLAGFYVVEVKTTGNSEFERLVAEGRPKDEHWRQCQIYIWGILRYYKTIPIQGGIILYENRDTLEHALFNVAYDAAAMEELMGRVKAMLAALAQGEMPDDTLPLDHWAHGYCPYLSLCSPGQAAVAWQKEHRPAIPETVMAGVIAKRIVAKQRQAAADGADKTPARPRQRSLDELATAFGWE